MRHTLYASQCTLFKHTLQMKSVLLQMHAQKEQGGFENATLLFNSTSALKTPQTSLRADTSEGE